VATGLALLSVLVLTIGYNLQAVVRNDVLRTSTAHYEVAQLLNDLVPTDAIVETWERELSILTPHQYHFPDQSFLIPAHAANYRNGPRDYMLGEDYFAKFHPAYVVVGWFGRWTNVYDLEYLERQATRVAVVGSGFERYEIFQFDWSSVLDAATYTIQPKGLVEEATK
jgi:hypothetical protein